MSFRNTFSLQKWLNRLVIFGLVLLFVLGKDVAKIQIGPIYFFDSIILLMLAIIKPSRLVYWGLKYWPFTLLILEAIVWMVYDVLSGGGMLVFRRFAMGFYFLFPVLLSARRMDVPKFVFANREKILEFLLGMALFSKMGGYAFGGSRVALLSGLLFMTFWVEWPDFLKKNRGNGKANIKIFFWLMISLGLWAWFGWTASGLYRSAVLSLVFGMVIWGSVIILRIISLHLHTLPKYLYDVLRGAFLFAIITFFGGGIWISVSPDIRERVQAGICDISEGSLGIVAPSASSVCTYARARGSPRGTVLTRTAFWRAIFMESIRSPRAFIIGNGHQHGFLEVVPTLPEFENMMGRKDLGLIEPHNSFFGLYFRYGLLGIVLFFVGLGIVSLKCLQNNYSRVLPLWSMLLFYTMFEVVLENPQGVVLFWLGWFLTCKDVSGADNW